MSLRLTTNSAAFGSLMATAFLAAVLALGLYPVAVLVGAGALALVAEGAVHRTRDRLWASTPPVERGRSLTEARTIVERYGEDSLSPFILRSDKSFLFADGAVVAYRRIGRTAVVSGDPVGPPDGICAALARLLAETREHGGRVVIYGASARHLDAYRALGLRTICTGEEAVVDPSRFSLEGRSVRKLRQSVHRVARRGWRVEVRRGGELDRGLVRELRDLDAAWRASHRKCLGFAMSTGERGGVFRAEDVFALAFSPEGHLCAAMRFLAHRGKLSLDTMQRAGSTPNGLNEALVCHLLGYARDRGIPAVSLNYAGLGHLFRRGPTGNACQRLLTRCALPILRSRFQMDRLVTFNEKFQPSWQPLYLVYESRLALPWAVARVLQAEGYLAGPPLPAPPPSGSARKPAPTPVLEESLQV